MCNDSNQLNELNILVCYAVGHGGGPMPREDPTHVRIPFLPVEQVLPAIGYLDYTNVPPWHLWHETTSGDTIPGASKPNSTKFMVTYPLHGKCQCKTIVRSRQPALL
jgi:hypothetical protein